MNEIKHIIPNTSLHNLMFNKEDKKKYFYSFISKVYKWVSNFYKLNKGPLMSYKITDKNN